MNGKYQYPPSSKPNCLQISFSVSDAEKLFRAITIGRVCPFPTDANGDERLLWDLKRYFYDYIHGSGGTVKWD